MLDHSSQFEPPHGHASPSPPPSAGASSAPGSPTATRLALTDFLDVRTLQEMQDSFAVITRLQTTIRDADGQPVTAPTDTARRDQSDRVLEQLIDADQPDDQPYTAPIVVEGQTLGSITIEHLLDTPPPETPSRLRELAVQLGVDPPDADSLIAAAEHAARPIKAAGVQFLYLMANSIARLCFKEFQLRQRVEELSVLYRLSRALARPRDVDQTIQTAANEMVQVMNVKAAAIRLLSDDATELVPRAVCNLSEQCLHTGPIRVEQSKTFTAALQGRVVCVHDIRTEPVVLDPEDAKREGLVSMLCAPMVHQDRPLGVIQLYTDQPRRFTDAETALVQTTAQLLAAYIHTARADAAQQDHLRLQRQLRLAGDVQRRLMPGVMPHLPPFDIAARYVPSLELSGDFYDFIDLDGHLGIAIGDVVGKGVAASLMMASVRASLRAYAQDIYDIDEVIARVNVALTRDTRDNEFATLFYGVLDPVTRRLTYCNAGHNPPLLLRNGQITDLDVGGMIVGIDADQPYSKGLLDLQPGDMLLLYTDGLTDAMNFDSQRFSLGRVKKALGEVADKSAHDAMNHVLWEMRRFAGLHTRTDDTTLVVIKVSP